MDEVRLLVRHLGAAAPPEAQNVARLGTLLHSSDEVHRTWRCHAKVAHVAARLLQHAAADAAVAASPVFWTTYAEAQLRDWKLSGPCAASLGKCHDGAKKLKERLLQTPPVP
jgi:hypothetical protein